MANNLIQCPACGTDISQKAAHCPHCGHKLKKPFYKRWWFWAIIAVVIVSGAAGNRQNPSESTIQSQSVQRVPAPSATQAAPESEESMDDISGSASNIFVPGDVLEASGLTITYQECDTNWTGYDRYMGPSDGKKVVRAYFIFENTGNSDQFCGSWNFNCYADGISCDMFLWGSDSVLSGGDTLSPGRKTQGYVYYEVPKSAESIELEYETSFWTQEKAIFLIADQ